MLSPGKEHIHVPRDLLANLIRREEVIAGALNDRNAQRGIIELCRQDCLLWVSLFVWQFNPRKKGDEAAAPFIPWEFQEQAILTILDCIEKDQDLCIEKSREMGASWLLIIVFTWLFLFHRYQKFLFISRSEAAVESDDPDSLFWKIDHILEHLPDWMKPEIRRRRRFFGNDSLKSTINGEASTGKAGVGGRATAMGIDEFSQIDDDYEVLHRTSDTTGCRIFNFTHKGIGTAAFELTQRVDMKKLQMHWTQHPDKKKGLYRVGKYNRVDILDKAYVFPPDYRFVLDGSPTGGPFPGIRSPWYDEQCRRKGNARAIAMDLDINAKGAVSQFFDALVIRELIERDTMPPMWEGDLEYDRDLAIPKQLVRRTGGPLKRWFHPDYNGTVQPARYAIGGDISAGSGATNSCLCIGNADIGEKIGEYVNPNIDPKDLAVLAVALCWLFKDREGQGASFGWEIPGPGQTMGSKVIELGYRNVYYRTDEFSLRMGVSDIPGWTNTPKNQLHLMEEYRSALRKGEFVNRSEPALEECKSFKYGPSGMVEHSNIASPNDPSGRGVNHGDLCQADAILHKLMKKLGQLSKQRKSEEAPPGSIQYRMNQRMKQLQAEEAWA